MTDLPNVLGLVLPGMLAMLGLIFASAFFSGSETALFYLSHNEVRGFRSGPQRQRMVAALLSNPDRLLTAVLFWNLVINLSYFATSVVITHRLTAENQTMAAGFFGLASLGLIILLGEVLPKSTAVVFRVQIAPIISWPLSLAVRLLDPVLPPLLHITRLARRTFWPHLKREYHLDEDDLERAVEISHPSDDKIRKERLLLHQILDLSEIVVGEAMRPRGTFLTVNRPADISLLKTEEIPGDVIAFRKSGTDDIDGATTLTDLSSFPQNRLDAVAEEIIHVPWCATLAYTLQLFRDRFCSVAAVVNEYGETIGIITNDDILDTVLRPEKGRAERLINREPVLEIAPGRHHVEGILTLRRLCRVLDIEYHPPADGQITVAGMVYEKLGHFPVPGDTCEWRGFRIRVIDVTPPAHIRVMIAREEATEE